MGSILLLSMGVLTRHYPYWLQSATVASAHLSVRLRQQRHVDGLRVTVVSTIYFQCFLQDWGCDMELNQGWSITTLQGRLSINAVRVLMRVVEYVQSPLRGTLAQKFLGRTVPHDFGDEIITIPYRYILPASSNNVKEVYDACQELANIDVSVYDEQKRSWRVLHLISSAWSNVNSGLVNVKVDKYIIDRILDFTRSFSRYDLEVALTLPSAYAARMYMLTCSSGYPVVYDIETLKRMLGCADKYPLTADFIKRVIDPAAKVLEACSANGYRYELIKKGKAYRQIRLIPIKRKKPTEAQVDARVGLTGWVGSDLKNYLVSQFGFTTKELGAHKTVLGQFVEMPAWPDRLFIIAERARRKATPKRYVIGAIKSEVSEWHGVRQRNLRLK